MTDSMFVLISRTSATTGSETIFAGIAAHYAASLLKKLADPQCHVLDESHAANVTGAEVVLVLASNKATFTKAQALLKALQEQDKVASPAPANPKPAAETPASAKAQAKAQAKAEEPKPTKTNPTAAKPTKPSLQEDMDDLLRQCAAMQKKEAIIAE